MIQFTENLQMTCRIWFFRWHSDSTLTLQLLNGLQLPFSFVRVCKWYFQPRDLPHTNYPRTSLYIQIFVEKRTLNSFITITRFYRFHQLQAINTMPLIIQSVYESCEFIHFKSSVKLNPKYYCNSFFDLFFFVMIFFRSFSFRLYHLILLSAFVMECRWHTDD